MTDLRAAAFLLLLLLPLCGLFAGCTGDPQPARGRGPSEQPAETLEENELRELIALSEVIVVARVEERSEKEGNVRLRLRVRECLRGEVPVSSELLASDFLYDPETGRGGSIGAITELGHYLFILAPGAKATSPRLHLRDPSQDPMPAAQPFVDQIRGLIEAGEVPGAKAPEGEEPAEGTPPAGE